MSQKNDTPALLISLLITIALIGGGVWWFTQRSNLGSLLGGNSGNSGSGSPLSSATAENFAGVSNIPEGVFNYGGSTTWAPIRGIVDPGIKAVYPQFQLRYTEPVSASPGSTTGIRMLLDNQLAFAQSSRTPKPEEFQEAQQRGFTLKEIPVAIEGIAIAVNPSLNISGLTVEQLKNIYAGQITNWSQIGGPNLSITPYSRPLADSATVEFFAENVLGNASFGGNIQVISTTTQAIRQVASDLGGIYFASAPEVVEQRTIKTLAVGRQPDKLFAPANGTIQSGEYPLTRRLFVIIKQNGQPDQQAGEAYANLLLTNQGQDLLTKAGFVRLR
jgi:phosphate transport system substrate-binding protein